MKAIADTAAEMATQSGIEYRMYAGSLIIKSLILDVATLH